MSSESEDDNVPMPFERKLGMCEACNSCPAKYTCPRCEVKTCSLSCLTLHKRELKCDGVRHKTKYISLAKMTKMDLMNDYYFLEECTKFVEDRKRDNNKEFSRYTKNMPPHLFRLRQAACDRQTTLRFLLQDFTKRQKNTSLVDFKSGEIFWRVEWCFPNGEEAILFADDKLSENVKLYDAIDKYLNPGSNQSIPGMAKIINFQSRGITGVQLLLKAEGIKRCRNRFFPLDINTTIRESLSGKTVVEFPTIYVVLNDLLEAYNIINSDDEVDKETSQHIHDVYKSSASNLARRCEASETVATDGIAGQLDKMNIDKMTQNKLDQKQSRGKRSQTNFLFDDENAIIETSSDSDQGNLNQEETSVVAMKRSKTQE